MVSKPTREYLWVLSRSPVISSEHWQEIESFLHAEGFDLSRLQGDAAEHR